MRLIVDGRAALDRPSRVAPSDIMGVLKRGDADSVEVDLVAGQAVDVAVEFRHSPAHAFGLWFGVRPPTDPAALLARAVAAARAADAVVLVVGETSDSGVESKDRDSTSLDPGQVALIEAVTQANPRTAVVANVGHAVDTRWEACAASLMLAWYPGEQFGRALAEVLAGDREPGGRMPVSVAREDEDYPALALAPLPSGDLVYGEGVLVGYRGIHAKGREPRHAFGSGIGYARFELLAAERLPDGREVCVTVANRSGRAGHEVVQIYRDEPELALVGFSKVWLAAGERRDVAVRLQPRLMRVWEGGWRRLPADTPLRAARSAADPGLRVAAPAAAPIGHAERR